MNEPVIKIENACVAYNGTAALLDVSLEVHAGESVVLLGPNGAGKTTLLTTVNGFTPLASGMIRVLNFRPAGRTLNAVRRRVGYVPQTQQLDPRMPITLRESVMTGLYGRRGWRQRVSSKDREAVDAVLEHLNILPLAERPLGHLSGGELRRATIARALVQQPDIMLLDEPTASLDDEARREICALMGDLNRIQRLTLLWVTHDLDALPDVCTRVIRMKQGRIVEDVNAANAAFNYADLSALLNGRGNPPGALAQTRCGAGR